MWRRLPYLFPIIICLPLRASPIKENKHYDWSKGLDTYHSSLSLPDGFVQNSLNVLWDLNAPVTKRQGYTVAFSTKNYAFQTAWTYVDPSNTSWIIVRDSDSVVANSLSGNASVLIATVSVNNLVGEANAFGNAFFTDQTNGVYFWNGTSTTYVSGSPKGSLITQWHGRVWVSGLAVPNGSQVWGSRQYDATSSTAWGTGINPNDPVTLVVGLQDNFDNITALYPFLDTLYTFRHFSTYAIYGFDQTSFQLSFITSECGCVDQNSIQTYNHTLIFVSERGVESFNGYTCTRISDSIKNMVDASIQSQGGANAQAWVQSQQADWQAGTSNQLDTSIASPSLVLSTFSATENSSTQWNLGSSNNISINPSSLTLSLNNVGTVTNPSFESYNVNTLVPDNWVNSGNASFPFTVNFALSFPGCTTNPVNGSVIAVGAVGVSGASGSFDAVDLNGNILATFSIPVSSCSGFSQYTLSPGANAGKRVKFRLHDFSSDGPGNIYLTTTESYIWGGPITFYAATGVGSSNTFFAFDLIQNGSSTITSGSFTSQVYNTVFTSAAYSLSNFNWTTNTSTPAFSLQTSSSSTGPWSTLLTSSGTNAIGNQYSRYVSTISIGASDNALTSINSETILATASTGTFKSQIHNLGLINSFGNFSIADSLNSGNINFSICSSTNSNMGTTVSCANQTANSQILVSTGTPTNNVYAQWYATFTVTAATQAPTLNSGVVQWFSGTNSAPMTSTVWDNRYWLSLSTNSADSFNDAVLVLNIAGAWGLFDLHAGGFVQYKNNLYHSDSKSSGNVYLDNQGYRDNGNAINAFIQTKDYCGEDINTEDYYESLYTSMDDLGNFNMTISYAMDRANGTPYTLSSVNQTEYANNTAVKVPFVLNSSNQNFGKCINFTFSESDLDAPWNFYGFTSYSHPREVQ